MWKCKKLRQNKYGNLDKMSFDKNGLKARYVLSRAIVLRYRYVPSVDCVQYQVYSWCPDSCLWRCGPVP